MREVRGEMGGGNIRSEVVRGILHSDIDDLQGVGGGWRVSGVCDVVSQTTLPFHLGKGAAEGVGGLEELCTVALALVRREHQHLAANS